MTDYEYTEDKSWLESFADDLDKPVTHGEVLGWVTGWGIGIFIVLLVILLFF